MELGPDSIDWRSVVSISRPQLARLSSGSLGTSSLTPQPPSCECSLQPAIVFVNVVFLSARSSTCSQPLGSCLHSSDERLLSEWFKSGARRRGGRGQVRKTKDHEMDGTNQRFDLILEQVLFHCRFSDDSKTERFVKREMDERDSPVYLLLVLNLQVMNLLGQMLDLHEIILLLIILSHCQGRGCCPSLIHTSLMNR
jgi:hypothetical protein